MTDKERILTELARKFAFETNKCTFNLGRALAKQGDLIMSASTGINEFTFGYFVENGPDGEYVIQELDSERQCRMWNDDYFVIPKDWFSPLQLLYGKQAAMEVKVRKAMRRLDWGLRYAGVEFDGNICKAKVRKVFDNEIQFEVDIPFNAKTTIKSIWAAIEQAKNEYEKNAKKGA